MATITFDIKGSVKTGGVVVSHPDRFLEVTIDGEVAASGCADAAIISAFGIQNLLQASRTEDVLSHYSANELLDFIISNHDFDVEFFISELQASLTVEKEVQIT